MSMKNDHSVMDQAPENELLEKLSNPQMIEHLSRLLDRVEQFNYMFDMMEKFVERGPDMADSVNDLLNTFRDNMNEQGYFERFESMLEMTNRVTELLNSEEFRKLLYSDLFHQQTEMVISKVSRSLTQATAELDETTVKRMNIFSLMKAVSDPDLQPALHFTLNFAKILSKELRNA